MLHFASRLSSNDTSLQSRENEYLCYGVKKNKKIERVQRDKRVGRFFACASFFLLFVMFFFFVFLWKERKEGVFLKEGRGEDKNTRS